MKQYMLEKSIYITEQSTRINPIRSLWGVLLLAYNLLRYKMVLMAHSLKGVFPNQLSFQRSLIAHHIIQLSHATDQYSPGNIPKAIVIDIEKKCGKQFVLGRKAKRAKLPESV